MSNSINNNFSAGNHLSSTQNKLNNTLARLSSGRRINSAKDDAAGLAISDRMDSQVRGLSQAVRNAYDGISMTQTADGALSESTDILQRMRELAVQSSNGVYNDDDRAAMNAEFTQLNTELERIAEETTFNDQHILDGSLAGGINFQVGANGDQGVNVTVDGATQTDLGTDSLSIGTFADAQSSLGAIDDALSTISGIRGELGATQGRFESTISNLENVAGNIAESNSRIADADYAAEVSSMLQNRILQHAGVAMQSQANQSAGTLLALLK